MHLITVIKGAFVYVDPACGRDFTLTGVWVGVYIIWLKILLSCENECHRGPWEKIKAFPVLISDIQHHRTVTRSFPFDPNGQRIHLSRRWVDQRIVAFDSFWGLIDSDMVEFVGSRNIKWRRVINLWIRSKS